MERMSMMVKYLTYAKIIRIVILLLLFTISCKEIQKNDMDEKTLKANNSRNKNGTSVTIEVAEKEKIGNNSKNNQILNESNIVEEVSFLKNQGIIGKNFSPNSVISYSAKESGNLSFCLLTTNYNKELGNQYSEEPIYSFLYIKKDGNLVNHLIVYSIYEDDFKFKYFLDSAPIYTYFDSSTGWSKLLIYSINENKFFATEKIDEALTLKKDGIKVGELEYSIDNTNQVKSFYSVDGYFPD